MKNVLSLVLCVLVLAVFSTSYASEKLYDKCKSCHGEDGSKKALGTSNSLKGQSKEDIIKN